MPRIFRGYQVFTLTLCQCPKQGQQFITVPVWHHDCNGDAPVNIGHRWPSNFLFHEGKYKLKIFIENIFLYQHMVYICRNKNKFYATD